MVLCHIHVQITAFFRVAIYSYFPIDGVDFIMGNDIASSNVYPAPEVVDVPISESEHDHLAQNHPGVFTVSILTRTQARKQARGFV